MRSPDSVKPWGGDPGLASCLKQPVSGLFLRQEQSLCRGSARAADVALLDSVRSGLRLVALASHLWGFRYLNRALLPRLPALRPEGKTGGGGWGCRLAQTWSVRPRFPCRQLVEANHVLSAQICSVWPRLTGVDAGWWSAEQVAESAWCPRQHILSLHLLLLYQAGGREEERGGPTSFKPCALTGMVGLALNFKRRRGSFLAPERSWRRVFRIQQETRSPQQTCSSSST